MYTRKCLFISMATCVVVARTLQFAHLLFSFSQFSVWILIFFFLSGEQGGLFDHGSLVNAIKGADVVISAVGTPQLDEQTRIVMAIKEAGNVIKVSEIIILSSLLIERWMQINR